MKAFDVVLVGSGISSLTCAALLSKKGKSVCVLEQYEKPGGYLHCFRRFGFRFDPGAHYVGAMGKGQAFHTLLGYLGVIRDHLFAPLDPDGFDLFHFPDGTVSYCNGYERTIERLTEAFPTEREAIRGFFQTVQDTVRHFQTYGFADRVDTPSLIRAMETPLMDVVERWTQHPMLQSLFCAYAALYGVPPREAPFGIHAIVTDSLIRGAYGLPNGGDALAQAYVDVITQQGGMVLLNKAVTRFETEGTALKAVETEDGERFEAEWVISGIHPKVTFGLIDRQEVLTPAFRHRLESLPETDGIFGIYAALATSEVPMHPLQNHFYFSTQQSDELLSSSSPDGPPKAVFLAPAERTEIASKTLPVNVHAIMPYEWLYPWSSSLYGRRPAEYKLWKEKYAAQVFAAVERYQPGFRRSIGKFVTSTPLSNRHFNGSPDGSAYGLYHSIQYSGVRSLGPRTHVANLLLTGQSTLFPGLLGAAISGLRTSGHILGMKHLLTDLRQWRGE